MHHLNPYATARRLSARAALLGLALLMCLAVTEARAAPDQVHPDRQTQTQPAPAKPKPKHDTLKHDAMNHGAGQAREYSDRAFLSSMLAHHEGAVSMADELLRGAPGSVNPKLARWAREIRKNQTKEMTDMRILLDTVGGLDKAAYQEMARQTAEMMKQSQGLDPNVRFVVLMIPHHASAVEMALPALLYSDSRRIAGLAQDIIEEQSEEIGEFRDWLSQQHHTL